MTITFYVRSVYGRDNIYLADETQAALVSTLTGLCPRRHALRS